MSCRRWTTCTLLAAALGACGGQEPAGDAESARPNVLLISIDSLRADHCTPYGYQPQFAPAEQTTPFLDQLAREGVLFENASAASPWTLPSHLSLFTAEPPRTHGVRVGRQMLPRDGSPNLANRFRDAGWATWGVWSAPFLHPAYGYAGPDGRAFQIYEPAENYLREGDNQEIITNPQMRRMMEVHGLADSSFGNAPRVNEIALTLLQAHADDPNSPPFFLFLHYWDVHYNYVPSEANARRFLPDWSATDARLGEDFTPAHDSDADPAYSPEQVDRIRALYDAEIRDVDDAIAEVCAKLDELGLAENTIVAVVSDHGDHFGEEHDGARHWFHHRTLFEEVVHVPWILRAPGRVPEGQRVSGSVALYDVGPTLLDLAGLPAWQGVRGRSARPLWEQGGEHTVLMDLFHPGVPSDSQAWREGPVKVIQDLGFPPTRNAPQGAPPFLRAYDLAQDPAEKQPMTDFEGRSWSARALEALRRAARGTQSAPIMEALPDTVREGLEKGGYADVIDADAPAAGDGG